MMKKVVAGTVALLFIALLSYRVAAARNDTQARADDRAQIEKLMWNYIRALDTANPDAYAAAYTPNGQFGTGANAVKGRDALRKMIADFKQRVAEDEAKGQKRQPLYHMLLNGYVEFSDRDHAHMEAYWLAVFQQTGPNVPARVAGAGHEVDELERVNGQWLIKLRDVAPKD